MKYNLTKCATALVTIATLASVDIHAEEPSLEPAQPSKLSQFTKNEPPCGITLSIIGQRENPVIAKGMPGTEHNKYGFEGGCVLKIDGVYHMFTSEMVVDPVHDKMMLAHWTSPDGLAWARRDTMFESSGSKDPKDIRSAFWAPMPVYNEGGKSTGWHDYRNVGMLKLRLN